MAKAKMAAKAGRKTAAKRSKAVIKVSKATPVKAAAVKAARAVPAPVSESWEQHVEQFFDRLLDDFLLPRWSSWFPAERPALRTPAVDIYDEPDAIVVKAELPGIAKQDLNLTLDEHALTIKGSKRKTEEVKKEHYHRWERTEGAFARTVALPAAVDPDHATATFKDGVLTVRMPRIAGAARKPIAVEAK